MKLSWLITFPDEKKKKKEEEKRKKGKEKKVELVRSLL